jgi:hypothetical protein
MIQVQEMMASKLYTEACLAKFPFTEREFIRRIANIVNIPFLQKEPIDEETYKEQKNSAKQNERDLQ